jgi:hypothetical protein
MMSQAQYPAPHPRTQPSVEARRKSILKHSDGSAFPRDSGGPARGSSCRSGTAPTLVSPEQLLSPPLGSCTEDVLHHGRHLVAFPPPPLRVILSPTGVPQLSDDSAALTSTRHPDFGHRGVSHSSSLSSPMADRRRVTTGASVDDFQSSSSSREGTPLLGRRGDSRRRLEARGDSVPPSSGTRPYTVEVENYYCSPTAKKWN